MVDRATDPDGRKELGRDDLVEGLKLGENPNVHPFGDAGRREAGRESRYIHILW